MATETDENVLTPEEKQIVLEYDRFVYICTTTWLLKHLKLFVTRRLLMNISSYSAVIP